VAAQQQHGVRALCSGEFDRKWYFHGFFEKLEGFYEVVPVPWELARLSAPPIAALKKTGKQYPMAAVCNGKIKYPKESPYLENWRMLKACVSEELVGECKFTMPPPCYFHLRLAPGKCYDTSVYASDEEFFADLAKAYQQELKTLFEDGCRNVQIDDPTLAYFCDSEMLESLKADGVDPDKLFEAYLKAHNDAIAGRPEGLHAGVHICRGKSFSFLLSSIFDPSSPLLSPILM
jgi:methionine synthase II (cobalamin-independent)